MRLIKKCYHIVLRKFNHGQRQWKPTQKTQGKHRRTHQKNQLAHQKTQTTHQEASKEVRYTIIFMLCSLTYGLPLLLPCSGGALFYLVQTYWSFQLFVVLMVIGKSRLIINICRIELLIMFLNLMAFIGYKTIFVFFYDNYSVMLDTLNLIELGVLLMWMPWNGAIARFSQFSDRVFNRIANSCRAACADKGTTW